MQALSTVGLLCRPSLPVTCYAGPLSLWPAMQALYA